MNGKQTPMMRTNAAVAGLNKVPGFDPVKLLQSALDSRPVDGAEKARLKLRYKKLWFRLACPQGCIRLNALRLTEQLAIIEARVYLNKADPEPVANFTAERKVQDSPLYIQAAQYEALDNALTDAGFGIQLCDVCQAVGEEAYTPRQPANAGTAEATLPPSVQKEEAAPTTSLEQPHAEEPGEETGAEQETTIKDGPITEEAAPAGDEEQAPPVTPAEEAPVKDAPAEGADPAVETRSAEKTAPVQECAPEAGDTPAEEPAAEEDSAPTQESGGYSPTMTVEEIAARMTLEEAMDIIADVGMCRGQTLAHIADKRPASLRWYVLGCKEASNVLKAGAKLVLESLTMQKTA